MADVLAGIRLVSSADVSGIKKMSAALSSFGDTFREESKSFASFGKLSAGFVGVGVAIEASLGFATAQALEYENLINRFAVNSRMASEGVSQIHDRMLMLSTGMNVSAETLAKLSISAGRLGLDAAGVEKFVLAGAKFAALSGGAITAEQAIGRMGNIANVFHLDLASNVNKIASSFVGLARTTTASEYELLELVNRTAELGKFVGFTVPQLAAMGATAKELGLDGRRAAGAMEGLFAAMTHHESMRYFARQVHMTGYEFRQALGKEPLKIIERLKDSFKGMNQVQIENKLKKMGITDNAQRTLVLGLAQNMDKLTKNLKTANDEFNKGTAANESYQGLLNSTLMVLDIFKNGLHAVAISFGEILLPPFKMVLEVGIFFVRMLLAIPTPIKIVMVAVAALTGALFILVGGFGLVATGLGLLGVMSAAFAASAFGATVAQAGFASALLITLAPMVANTLGLIANTFAVLDMVLATITLDTVLAPLVGIFWAAAGGIWGMAAAAIGFLAASGIGEILLIAAAAGAVLYVAWIALKPVLSDLWDALMLLAEPFKVLSDGFSEIAAMFGTGGSGFGGMFKAFIRLALFPIILVVKEVTLVIRGLASVLTGMARMFVSLVKPIIAPFAALYNFVLSTAEAISDMFNGFVDGGGKAIDIFEGIADAAGFVFKWLTPIGLGLQAIGAVFEFIGFVATNVFEGISEAFGDFFVVLRGIGGEIQEAFAPVMEALDAIIQPFRDIATEWLGITEGGTGFAKAVGSAIRFVTRGVLAPFVLGLELVASTLGFLVKAFGPLVTMAVNAVGRMVQPWADFGKFITDLVALVVDTVRAIPEAVEHVWDSLVGLFTNLAPRILESLGSAFEGVLNKVSGIVQTAAKQAINSQIDMVNGLLGPINAVLPKSLEVSLIPRLARGAIATKPTVAMIGEGPEPEAVIPLSRLSGMLATQSATVPRTVERAASTGGGAQTPVRITIPVSVILDGVEIGRTVAEVTEEQIRRQFGNKKLRFSGVG